MALTLRNGSRHISTNRFASKYEKWKCARRVQKRPACQPPRAVPGTYPTRRRHGGASSCGSHEAYRSFAFVREREANRHFGMIPVVYRGKLKNNAFKVCTFPWTTRASMDYHILARISECIDTRD